MDHVPSFTSVARYLENPALTPVLKSLIEQSALPLSSVEVDFAVDSSAFPTTTYQRWYDHKWGKTIKESQWALTQNPTFRSTYKPNRVFGSKVSGC